MAERNRATVHVQPAAIDRQLAQAGEDLRRKRLVQFHQADPIERDRQPREKFPDRGDGSDAETLRRDAGGGVAEKAGERLKPEFPCIGLVHQHDSRRAVARLRGVTRRDRTLGVERRLERGKCLERCIAPRPFVGREGARRPGW